MSTVDDREARMDAIGAGHDRTELRDGARGNLLLASLPAEERARLEPALERVPMASGQVLYEPDAPIAWVYFPHDAVLSVVSPMSDGTVEVGTVGREGMAGVPILLHSDRAPTRTFVQVAGSADRMPAARLSESVRSSPVVERTLYRYAQSYFDQVAQTAACNRLHTLEERCARWLLMTQDRTGSDHLPLTQQFLSYMLGVHRPAVTLAAGALQKAGLIHYTRGKVTVTDRAGLEAAACACYAATRRSVDRLLHGIGSPAAES
jgi:CRP-like cAMP-binding protein